MAKKKRSRTHTTRQATTMPAGEAALAAAVPVIDVPAGTTLEVIVDVGPMVIPYTVAYDGRTIIKSLVDRSEPVNVRTGDFILAWAFGHSVKEWSHSIGYSLGGGPMQVLEQRSEANKDPDHSVGFALVRA
ncbi:MAG TPA: hypothetical protein VES67_06225 [Vicinamibacterales bacterium]|nr:hypothetical protein [Vicinamibacterales bacterium]